MKRESVLERLTYETVKDPENLARGVEAGKMLRQMIKKAVAQKKNDLCIPAGDYCFLSGKGIDIECAADLHIRATGATFWFLPNLKSNAISFRNCRRVRLSGLEIDMIDAPFLQGTIKNINPEEQTVTVTLDPGFMEIFAEYQPPKNYRVMFLDEKGGSETDNIDCRPETTDLTVDGQGNIRVKLESYVVDHWKHQLRPPKIDDRIVLGIRKECGMLSISSCGDMIFEDVSIYAASGFAFFECGFGDGANRYRNCRLIRRPGSNRLLAGAADCFHSLNQRRGPVIEECEFSWAMDDLVNIHGFFQVVIEVVSGSELVVAAPGGSQFVEEEELFFYSPPYCTPRGYAKVKSHQYISYPLKEAERKAQQYYRKEFGIGLRDFDYATPCRITLDRELDIDPFDLISSYGHCGAGAVLRNNYLHHGHVRGILLKSRGGTVENNRIEHIALNGIALKPELYWLEGPIPRDIAIKDNTLVDCAFGYTGVGAILVMIGSCPPPSDRFIGTVNAANITISGNLIDHCNAGPGIVAANCEVLTVSDNQINHPFSNPLAKGKTAVENPANYCTNVSGIHKASEGIYFISCRQIDFFGNNVTSCT